MSSKDQVINILASHLNRDSKTVKPSDNIINDLKADKLDLAEILISLEDQFDVSIPDEEVEKMQTVQNVIDCIDSKKNN